MLNPLDAVQAQYSIDDIPKAVNNVNLTRMAITVGTVVVLCVTVFIKSQLVLNVYMKMKAICNKQQVFYHCKWLG